MGVSSFTLSSGMRGKKNNKHVLDCDESLGHCFSYVSPLQSTPSVIDENRLSSPSSSSSSSSSSSFRSIFGASVSANATATGCVLESSPNFAALPIQFNSNRIGFDGVSSFSGPITGEKGRASGTSLLRSLSERTRKLSVVPVRYSGRRRDGIDRTSVNRGDGGGSVEWAHGKAGEDRVHVVVSEENKWLFVGIYDGFNGPGAPEFLVSNLYRTVIDQLRLTFSEEDEEAKDRKESVSNAGTPQKKNHESTHSDHHHHHHHHHSSPLSVLKNGFRNFRKENGSWSWSHKAKKGEESDFDLDARFRRRLRPFTGSEDHSSVLGALSKAMETIELNYLKLTEAALSEHPELAIMGSGALVVFVRGKDVYVMNLGDSSAVIAQMGENTSPELTTALELTVNHSTNNIEVN